MQRPAEQQKIRVADKSGEKPKKAGDDERFSVMEFFYLLYNLRCEHIACGIIYSIFNGHSISS